MRTVRLFIAALLALSLAVLPASAAMARTHIANADMTMSAVDDAGGDDCPCCSGGWKCASRIC
ncbi:MAG TPA: hypothetical protein VFE11_07610, partial [Dongiaceae bacterium]|nr:hypothetical protein [Dongiaceae bacterium]